MKKLFLIFILIFSFINLNGQQLNPNCSNILGEVFASSNGLCTQFTMNPPIQAGTLVEKCFTFQYTNPIHLSYIIATGSCGPFPLYTNLSFKLYNANCDTLIQMGNIFPSNTNTYIDYLIVGNYYILCYEWDAECDQTSMCPLIFNSLLPIDLLYFKGEYNRESKYITLTWATASEINSDYFLIEESEDLDYFKQIIRVKAQGNSNIKNEYIAIGYSSTNKSILYYKLNEIDLDGNVLPHGIIYVNIEDPINGEMEIFDLMGVKQNKLKKGVNIVKKNNIYYKVIKFE